MDKIAEALHAGWIVSSVANVLAHGKNDEGRGFLITLAEPNQHLICKVYLPGSEEAIKLFSNCRLVSVDIQPRKGIFI